MNFLTKVFTVILYQPLFNGLILLYQFVPGHDFGIAVIILTLLIRLALFPLMIQSLRSQKNLSILQKKVQKIQNQHKKNKEKQMEEVAKLYQEEKINPLGGCLPLLAQFPILIALYQVFRTGLTPETFNYLYSFVPQPEIIDSSFLGLLDLSQPNWVLAILAGISQFFQTQTISKAQGQASNQMLYIFPIITIFFLLRLPAAVGLYWLITIFFSILQQNLVYKRTQK